MISVEEARSLIRQNTPRMAAERSSLEDALGGVLAEDLYADRAYPPFHRVAMDGFAINADAADRRQFHIEGLAPAGAPEQELGDKKNCFEVMTGAPLPRGCDSVIPIEFTSVNGCEISVNVSYQIKKNGNVHTAGSDCPAGRQVLKRGQQLTGPRVAVAASIGAIKPLIMQKPRVSIVCTGDEVIDPATQPLPHQIRDCNNYAVLAALAKLGINRPAVFRVKDEPKQLLDTLDAALRNSHLLLTIGGVSKGKFDYLPSLLNDLKVEKIFHRVSQRPGKPLWFGQTEEKKMVFGLPGNPISVLTTLYAYVLPCLENMLGMDRKQSFAELGEEINFSKKLTYFAPCSITETEDGLRAIPTKFNGSGDFVSLSESAGFIELERERHRFIPGERFAFYPW